jgi:hypothetical protein
MQIDKYKITLNRFTAELQEPLDRTLRTLITAEAEIYDVSNPDNHDNTYDQVYKAKVVGSTIVKQGDKKPVLTKSKRSKSQKLRQAIWAINPNEDFYDITMDKIINNIEEVIELTKNL